MTRYADTRKPAPDSPLPPTYSRLSADPLSGRGEDGAPAGPYFGPGGPPPRGARRGTAAWAGTASTGAPTGRQRTVSTPAPSPIMRVLDRTAAHGAPLTPQPDDAAAVAGASGSDASPEPGRPGVVEAGRGVAAPDRALADLVADRLERLAARIRAKGDPRLARATDSGEPLDAVLADIVGDYLRDRGA